MKKMKGIKIVFFICFFSMSQTLFSQENKSKPIGGKPTETGKKNASTNSPEIKTKVSTSPSSGNTNNVQKQIATQENSFQLDENDSYQGRKEEFLSQLIVKELPSDFPKYEKWMGVRHYNEVISDYYKKHLDILIPTVKQKLEQIH